MLQASLEFEDLAALVAPSTTLRREQLLIPSAATKASSDCANESSDFDTPSTTCHPAQSVPMSSTSASIYASYFDRFPAFTQYPRRSIRDEFDRLAKTQHWQPEETKHQRATCYNEELEGHYASLHIHDKHERLKHLSVELEIEPLDTFIECKKALRKLHVNLVDLMDARRMDKKVHQFNSLKELSIYSKKTKKIYPQDEAEGDVVEVLLRHIDNPSRAGK
ncbi:hypothetical protein D6D10_03805 [Aureobasidium pullulans]|uniref:Uncharacterized protein n=1 Tax=Aureobasidium pullulans TaxID=5580 RepID=A0A4S9EYV4_AURPU|nr:hypothetical protein D6D10_03805 [Aureobasidium pullulans]